MSYRLISLLTLLTGLSAAPPVLANDAMPLPADATPEAAAAYAVLDKHCARCHQEGALKEGLTSSKSGFDFVLDLERLAQDTKYVVHGDDFGSKLYAVIGPYSYPAMPDDCSEESCFPTAEETAAVSDWIKSLANNAPEPRPLITLAEQWKLAFADLQTQPTNRRDRIRYFSLRDLHNDPDVSDENLEGYRAATVKLINALSWNPTIYKAQAVDEHGTLLRVFLPDLDWTHDTWRVMEAQYPYGMTSATDPHLKPLQDMAGTLVPVMRADWFAATASVSPMYYDILGLPDTVQGLEAMLNLDMVRNIRDEQVIRAGFQDSGVSTHNRLIERHALGSGFFWTSYDFAGSQGRQSFFEYPLGPTEAYGPSLAFQHDGGESIFTLPNGFHAYYLNTAEGDRLDVGPTQIVRDDDYTDGTGEVVNGISCISCHSKGIRLNEDKVRDVALNDLALPPAARQVIDAIYPGQEEVAKWLQADTDAFRATLAAADIDPDITAGGLEPVRGLFVYHVDLYIDFVQAANELGLTEEELRQRAGFVGADMASLLMRLDTSPIARDEWTTVYPVILERVTDYTPIYPEEYDASDLSYTVKTVVEDNAPPDYRPVARPADYTPPATYADTPPAHVNTDHNAPARSLLTVYTDKPAYKVGEGLRIFVEPRKDCRLTLISIDDRRRSCVLYPHPALADEVIPGGSRYVFPPQGTLTTSEPGKETILAVCNASPDAISALRRDTSKVSCDPNQRQVDYEEITYKDVALEVLAFNPAAEDKTTVTGADYSGLSTLNPDVAKAQISVPVTAH
jgi:mono/diheme cytochrome c family protein